MITEQQYQYLNNLSWNDYFELSLQTKIDFWKYGSKKYPSKININKCPDEKYLFINDEYYQYLNSLPLDKYYNLNLSENEELAFCDYQHKKTSR